MRIGGRALDILTVLVERPGAVIGKQELLSRVWPDTFVEEGNLKVNMAALRRVLDEPQGAAHYISTVVGRGYRFSAPVRYSSAFHHASNADTPASLNHNLPTATARIVGRQDAIDAILLELQEARLVSIVGAGGIGKTTVALAVAERWIGTCRDGVWLVDLSPLKDPNLVPNAIATAIGLTAHSSNMLEALSAFLRTRQMLLVFDSCEHIINGIASCADRILAEAPAVRILATSRESLRVKGERVRRLPGLGTPARTTELDAQSALAFPAIELFVNRATDRIETFSLSDAEAPLAAELCRQLDGLALAIELAATRVDAFGLSELIEQLGDRLRLLQGHRAGIERHRTLTATIDWSYDLLSEIERMVFRRLATFAGIFSLDSACAITIDEHLDRTTAVESIASLVAKSLLAAEMHDTQVEYRMLDTTRAYALEKLVANNELKRARQRHAEHCLDLVERATSDAERLTRTEWLVRYGPKTNDIRDAMRWAFTNADQTALGVRLTVTAIPFGKQVSLVEECRIAVQRALDDRFQAHRSIRDDLVLNLTLGATLLHTRGPLQQVKSCLTKALTIAEQLRDADMQLACLRGLSEYELWTGDSHSAIAVSRKIRLIESNGQVAISGGANAQAGSALSWLGALAASRQQLETIVQRPINQNARSDVARFEFDQRLTAQGSLATVLWLQGFPDQAVAVARRQLKEAEASNYAVSLCSALLHGSLIISMYVRDYDAAWTFLDRGLEHAQKHGLSIWRNMAMCTRGRMCLYANRPIDLAAYRDALAEVRDGGFRMRYPNYLANYAEAVARQGDLAGGLAAIDEAIALCESRGQVVGIPEILRIKGNMFRFQDPADPDRAEACYRRSIELARQGEALSWELRSAMSLVKLRRMHGGDNEAENMLSSTYDRFQEGFSTGDLVRARALIATRPGARREK
ncbi:putative ATPase [Hoeflea marina]|uniref:Putative ATPase n=1 Tax=Hoeflea marina TaxID=274592 RepID=A0A317PTS1_9HYPH|nr:putative ATPase [Hoeflea marina]